MMARLVALVLLAAPLSWGYALHAAPRSLAASLPASSTQMSVVKGLTLKTKVKRAAMAAKGRHRLCVFKSNKHIYAQVIDDATHRIMAAASSVEADLKEKGLNIETAKEVGAKAAARAKEKGIELVYFDRNGYKYHGRIAALADAAREGGLTF